MKKINFLLLFFLIVLTSLQAQTSVSNTETSDLELKKKATEWVSALNLNDGAKESRVQFAVFTHLKSIYDWNKNHPFTMVPEGNNPRTGDKLTTLDRQMIVDSSQPDSVHLNLMAALRKDLTENQVELVLDKYTIGKVAFTLGGYKSIVPDLTVEEEKVILTNLKTAREIAVDYKSMKQISAIFEIYKSKNEQYLNSNGRNWKALYKAFTDAAKRKKAAKAAEMQTGSK